MSQKKQADLLFYNARIYTVDAAFSQVEAMAIKDGKILETGSSSTIRARYSGAIERDAQGKTIIPGIIDAHLHLLELGKTMQQIDLKGTKSFDAVLERLRTFQKRENPDFIMGYGWDQTHWPNPEFPSREKLDVLFPHTPVMLTRIDLHACLINRKMMDRAGITINDRVEGGAFIKEKGRLTGMLLDNAMDKVLAILPKMNLAQQTDALLKAQDHCFQFGITSIVDAAMTHEMIQLMDGLSSTGQLKIGIYPMLLASDPHLEDYLFKGMGNNKAVSCRAIKVFGDGAVGSRGAALEEGYSDDPGNKGQLRIEKDTFEALAQKIAQSNFQLNTHAIGDLTNHLVLQAYHKALKGLKDRRWRVEHAQIVNPEDLPYFSKNCIPSIQPIQAVSDMDWIGTRLGPKRLKQAYTNKSLLKQAGLVAIGTDAPVEKINPFFNFYAAVYRKNEEGLPEKGFMPEQRLTREEALKGMTIWAAYAQFSEKEIGSLEKGKQADFVVLDQNILEINPEDLSKTEVISTFLKGNLVFENPAFSS